MESTACRAGTYPVQYFPVCQVDAWMSRKSAKLNKYHYHFFCTLKPDEPPNQFGMKVALFSAGANETMTMTKVVIQSSFPIPTKDDVPCW
jgi:hypothetical protein